MTPVQTLPASTAAAAPPGRSCPLHYRYSPAALAVPPAPDLSGLDVLYLVGGLYGNELALQQVLALFAREPGRKRLVFNGDFHWFDADPAVFERVQRGVLAHTALRGNVETELATELAPGMDDPGCGCAYPDWVGDQVVERSNRILTRLRQATTPVQRQALAALPMWLRAEVGGLQLGVVHGDAQSLAGWGFAQEALRSAAHRAQLQHWFEQAQVQAFASTHTCLPVFQRLQLPGPGPAGTGPQAGWIFNNGATGMPNFAGDGAGLLTRVARAAFDGPQRRFGVVVQTGAAAVHVEGIAVEIDAQACQQRFLAQWPEGSDAHASYFERIARGPAYRLDEVVRAAEPEAR